MIINRRIEGLDGNRRWRNFDAFRSSADTLRNRDEDERAEFASPYRFLRIAGRKWLATVTLKCDSVHRRSLCGGTRARQLTRPPRD